MVEQELKYIDDQRVQNEAQTMLRHIPTQCVEQQATTQLTPEKQPKRKFDAISESPGNRLVMARGSRLE